MLLYHGSNLVVDSPKLVSQNRCKEQTIEALKVKQLYNQLVLTSERALGFLKFIGTVTEEEV